MKVDNTKIWLVSAQKQNAGRWKGVTYLPSCFQSYQNHHQNHHHRHLKWRKWPQMSASNILTEFLLNFWRNKTPLRKQQLYKQEMCIRMHKLHWLLKMKQIPGPSSSLPRSPKRKTSKSCSGFDGAEVLLCKFAPFVSATGVGIALELSWPPSLCFLSTDSAFRFSRYCFS